MLEDKDMGRTKKNNVLAYESGVKRNQKNETLKKDYRYDNGLKKYSTKHESEPLLMENIKRSKTRREEIDLNKIAVEEDLNTSHDEYALKSRKYRLIAFWIVAIILATGLGYGLSFLIPDDTIRRNTINTNNVDDFGYTTPTKPTIIDEDIKKGISQSQIDEDYVPRGELRSKDDFPEDKYVELETLNDDWLYLSTKTTDSAGVTTTTLRGDVSNEYVKKTLLEDNYLYTGTGEQPESLALPSVSENYFAKNDFTNGELYLAKEEDGSVSFGDPATVVTNKYIAKETLSENIVYQSTATDESNKDTISLTDATNQYTNTEDIINGGLYKATKTTVDGVTTTDFGEDLLTKYVELNTLDEGRLYNPVKNPANDEITSLSSRPKTDYIDGEDLNDKGVYLVTKETDSTTNVERTSTEDVKDKYKELNLLNENMLHLARKTDAGTENEATTLVEVPTANYLLLNDLEEGLLLATTPSTGAESTTLSGDVSSEYIKKPEGDPTYTVKFDSSAILTSTDPGTANVSLGAIEYKAVSLSLDPAQTDNLKEIVLKVGESKDLYYTVSAAVLTNTPQKPVPNSRTSFGVKFTITLDSVDENGKINYTLSTPNSADETIINAPHTDATLDPLSWDTINARATSHSLHSVVLSSLISGVYATPIDIEGTEYIKYDEVNKEVYNKHYQVSHEDPGISEMLFPVEQAATTTTSFISKKAFKVYLSGKNNEQSIDSVIFYVNETRRFYIIGPNARVAPAAALTRVHLVEIDVTLGEDGNLTAKYVSNNKFITDASASTSSVYSSYIADNPGFATTTTNGVEGTAVPKEIVDWLFVKRVF